GAAGKLRRVPRCSRSGQGPDPLMATDRRPPTARRRSSPPPVRARSAAPAASGLSRSRTEDRSGARALGRIDGVRGQRDGHEASGRRRSRKRSGRVALVALAIIVLVGGVLMLVLAPLQSYRNQQSTNADRKAELDQVEAEREEVRR